MAVLRTFTGRPARWRCWAGTRRSSARETDDPEALAGAVQRAVLDETGLSCSVGIGDNLLRAKIATEFGKPAGSSG